MNRTEALEYVEIAAYNRIKERCKYILNQDYELKDVKLEVEYYEEVMRYIKDNLK
jgi:hypothetical protein